MIIEAAAKSGESYIALRENSFKLRSSFPYRPYRLPGYFLPVRREELEEPMRGFISR